ncbi:uro-adherence factor A-like [Dermacentor albipictus]|uniref:uro-adherence factor A-like n=1 Tax=Dermacentor albipictus TaxID=60249 RepID=UPI0038FC1F78
MRRSHSRLNHDEVVVESDYEHPTSEGSARDASVSSSSLSSEEETAVKDGGNPHRRKLRRAFSESSDASHNHVTTTNDDVGLECKDLQTTKGLATSEGSARDALVSSCSLSSEEETAVKNGGNPHRRKLRRPFSKSSDASHNHVQTTNDDVVLECKDLQTTKGLATSEGSARDASVSTSSLSSEQETAVKDGGNPHRRKLRRPFSESCDDSHNHVTTTNDDVGLECKDLQTTKGLATSEGSARDALVSSCSLSSEEETAVKNGGNPHRRKLRRPFSKSSEASHNHVQTTNDDVVLECEDLQTTKGLATSEGSARDASVSSSPLSSEEETAVKDGGNRHRRKLRRPFSESSDASHNHVMTTNDDVVLEVKDLQTTKGLATSEGSARDASVSTSSLSSEQETAVKDGGNPHRRKLRRPFSKPSAASHNRVQTTNDDVVLEGKDLQTTQELATEAASANLSARCPEKETALDHDDTHRGSEPLSTLKIPYGCKVHPSPITYVLQGFTECPFLDMRRISFLEPLPAFCVCAICCDLPARPGSFPAATPCA